MVKIVIHLFILMTLPNVRSLATSIIVQQQRGISISDALKMAQPHDTIYISQGIYKEHDLVIDKPVTIIGLDEPVIDGNKESGIFMVQNDSVTISGLFLRGVGNSYTDDLAAIKVENSQYCQILNNTLEDSFFGIYLKKSRHTIISGNKIIGTAKDEVNSGNGIHLWNCFSIDVSDNYVSGHRDGIYFEFVEESRITGNVSERNLRYGLHFMFSNKDDYINNQFISNGTGVAVMFSKNIRMLDNTFKKNWGSATFGLLLKEIYDGELSGNTFIENTTAIFADGSTRIVIENNNFIRNGWAMNIFGNCTDNRISGNNFIGNTFDVSTNSSSNKNLYANNYWDQYTGYDLDKNGYGDIPHHPVKLFSLIYGRVPESIILLRSFFIDMINLAEKVTPVLTPVGLQDDAPSMKRIQND